MRVVGKERQRILGSTLVAVHVVTREDIETGRATGRRIELELSADDWAAMTADDNGTEASCVLVARIALVDLGGAAEADAPIFEG